MKYGSKELRPCGLRICDVHRAERNGLCLWHFTRKQEGAVFQGPDAE